MEINREEIAKRLADMGATNSCHRCGNNSFAVMDCITNIQLQEKITRDVLMGPGTPILPVAHLVCEKCGAVTSHALGVLNMLPVKEDNHE